MAMLNFGHSWDLWCLRKLVYWEGKNNVNCST